MDEDKRPEESAPAKKIKVEQKLCMNTEEMSDLEKHAEKYKEVNKLLREIHCLKSQNRIREQQQKVHKLKEEYGSYRHISSLTGISLNTVHLLYANPKERKHKGTARAEMKKEEFLNSLCRIPQLLVILPRNLHGNGS